MRKGDREGETAKGFRQLVQHAVNKHIVCRHSGTVQRAAVCRGVTLFRFKNICSHQQQYKLHFQGKRKRSIHAEGNTSTEEKKHQKTKDRNHNSHIRKSLSAHKSFRFPVSMCFLSVSPWLCTCKPIGEPEQSNQVVSRSVKHEQLIQQLRDLRWPLAETVRLCFLTNSTSHCADDSAITLQSTVQEISQQPQITDTQANTRAKYRATKIASYILMTSRHCNEPLSYTIIIRVSVPMKSFVP